MLASSDLACAELQGKPAKRASPCDLHEPRLGYRWILRCSSDRRLGLVPLAGRALCDARAALCKKHLLSVQAHSVRGNRLGPMVHGWRQTAPNPPARVQPSRFAYSCFKFATSGAGSKQLGRQAYRGCHRQVVAHRRKTIACSQSRGEIGSQRSTKNSGQVETQRRAGKRTSVGNNSDKKVPSGP